MSGNPPQPAPDPFPAPSCPTTFADGVLNASVSQHIVKYYLYRFEPSLRGDNQYQTQAVGQIVMPIEGGLWRP
jgi:hypothetical protein